MLKFNQFTESSFIPTERESRGDSERAKIIKQGRLLMWDSGAKTANIIHNGSVSNGLSSALDTAEPRMKSLEYAENSKKYQSALFLWAANKRANAIGRPELSDMDEFRANQQSYFRDPEFLRILAGVIEDTINPILPTTMSTALSWLAEMVSVPHGQTYELDVRSNDVVLFEDDSWGASRSKPANELYSYPITLNPRPKTARFSIKWSQWSAQGSDMGQFLNSLAAGMYSKITAMFGAALVSASTNTFYTPTNLQFATNSSANWTTAIKRVAMVNGGGFRNVVAYGDYSAIAKALPSGVVNASSVNLDAALSTMLGVEWARFGYIGEYMGARIMPIDNAIVPGTQNTTISEVLPTDRIWFASTAGYKPVYVGIDEATPIQLQLDPSITADGTIDVLVTVALDAKPVFGSKVATMSPM